MAIEYANSDPIKVTHTKGSANGGIKYTNTLPWKVELTNDDLAYQEDITNLQRQINALEADLTWRDPVTNYEDLPTTGNDDGDVRLVTSTGVLYVWAGSEWVALNENKGGGTLELTEADYNWNSVDRSTSGTLDSFALWLLEDGLYSFETGIPISKLKTDKNNSVPGATPGSTNQAPSVLILSGVDGSKGMVKTFMLAASQGTNGANRFIVIGTGIDGTPKWGGGESQFGLTRSDVINDLNGGGNTGHNIPLSAKQGKVLKDMINNLSGITELTAADYATGKQYIEAWTLPVGLYRVNNHGKLPSRSAFVHWRPYIGNTSVEQGCNVFLVADHSQNSSTKTIVCFYTTGGDSLGEFKISVYSVNYNDGNLSQQYRLISSGEVKDSLTETTTNMPLSANQGRVLKSMIDNNVVTIVQTTGQSTTSVMSQKAVTDIIGDIETILQTLTTGTGA